MIIEEAKKTNNCATARAHGIDESQIRKWRKVESKLREAFDPFNKSRYRLEGAGRKLQN